MQINEELLKKENITIENSIKLFDEYSKNVNDLKIKIEKEIIEIDKLYEKTDKEVTKSFELKHEKLNKEENNLKEKLQTEVTKIKEKLEEYLSLSNELIRNYERIKKGIKTLEKEDNNLIKTLSYVSKINKIQKEMKKLFQIIIKNIKITYDEKENNIKYEEYFFNGIPPIKDIIINDISLTGFKIYWKIDEPTLNMFNIDKNKIIYIVEIRNENENENFKKVYEGKDMNCVFNNLNKDTTYEIRICYNINNIWSEIKKVKTLENVFEGCKDKALNSELSQSYLWINLGSNNYPERVEKKYHSVGKMDSLGVLEKEKEICRLIIDNKKKKGEDYIEFENKLDSIEKRLEEINANISNGILDFENYKKNIKT